MYRGSTNRNQITDKTLDALSSESSDFWESMNLLFLSRRLATVDIDRDLHHEIMIVADKLLDSYRGVEGLSDRDIKMLAAFRYLTQEEGKYTATVSARSIRDLEEVWEVIEVSRRRREAANS